MNYIYTLDTGGFITPQTTASHTDAAERWGAEYRVLTGAIRKRSDPFGVKLELWALPLEDDDRVLWLDGDTLIRDDCPSPFALVEPTHFAGVANYQGDTHANPDLDHLPAWDQVCERLPGPVQYDRDTYINGGVLLWTHGPHRQVFYQSDTVVGQGGRVNPMIEQTAQNVALALTRVPLTVLPHTFNRLGPSVWGASGPMTSYVYHYANIHHHRGDKAAAMGRVEWRVEPCTTA